MKKLLTSVTLFFALMIAAVSTNAQTPAVLKVFNAAFGEVANVKWTEANDVYTAFFTQNDITHTISYERDGSLVSSKRISNGERLLPVNILHSIKQKYAAYTINSASEIYEEGTMNFTIEIHNEKEMIILSATANGILRVVDKMTK